MYALIFILIGAPPSYLGNYSNLSSCQNAIREIYRTRVTPPGQVLPELEKSITMAMNTKKEFICIPVPKD